LVIDSNIYSNVGKNSKIIDLGCGSCFTLLHLEKHGYRNLYGIDINKNIIEYARNNFNGSNIKVLNYDITDNKLESNTFDYAILEALITVLVDNNSIYMALCETYRILKKGGTIQIDDFCQNWHNDLYQKRYLSGEKELGIDGAFVVYGTSNKIRYLARHISMRDLSIMLKDVGFGVVKFFTKDVVTQSGNKIIGFSLFARK